ncbi:Sjoegren syndrome nuclear autoantigen 1 [Plasmodiophora brassicae]|uniref:Sjoegren syndrome nuclear autoantigen 1 n=1 Tax=Plasmodiophora brassicae TaxID=37360 RepID=A0A0G4IV79_PLABS|nr:hypothetical protein PBRA_007183 [Plasmodiophora brassicae]SPQ98621.1 unnamed protein product [Plasmodiophora brassicae]
MQLPGAGPTSPTRSVVLDLNNRAAPRSPCPVERSQGLGTSVATTTMASQGATLQNYNTELVKCIEDLRQKRDHVGKCIEKEERDKAIVQKELATLTEKLHRLNESIAQKVTARTEYDRTIHETEAAYMKILESSQTLLHVLKRETVNLSKKRGEVRE